MTTGLEGLRDVCSRLFGESECGFILSDCATAPKEAEAGVWLLAEQLEQANDRITEVEGSLERSSALIHISEAQHDYQDALALRDAIDDICQAEFKQIPTCWERTVKTFAGMSRVLSEKDTRCSFEKPTGGATSSSSVRTSVWQPSSQDCCETSANVYIAAPVADGKNFGEGVLESIGQYGLYLHKINSTLCM